MVTSYPKGKTFNKNSSKPPSMTLDVPINRVYKKKCKFNNLPTLDMEIK